MSDWSPHLVTPEEVVGARADAIPFSELLDAFLEWQTPRWPLLQKMRGALAEVEQRTVQVGDHSVIVQFNPGRTVNSTAKVDAASIEKRPCFLCAENLPPEEKGLAFGAHSVILANPFPIMPVHFVIARREHRPQDADVALDALLDIALGADGALTVFYNGPTSGASAPDHLHLQAVGGGSMPEENHALEALASGQLPGVPVFESPQVRVWSDTSAERWVVGFVGQRHEVARAVRASIATLSDGSGAEPPLNLVATAARPGEIVVLLFPRAAHRPAMFYADDPDRRVVSPGAIDMAGVIVTVRHEDYARLRPQDLAQIFSEVSRPAETDRLRTELARRLS